MKRCAFVLAASIAAGEAHADDDIARGRALFEPCQACHTLEPGKTGMAGPDLIVLKGRRVGGAQGFDYSPAMRRAYKSGAVWDEARLVKFLADPDEMFPGLWMSAQPMRNEAERRALAAFLLR